MSGLYVALGVFVFGGLGSAARFWLHRRLMREDAGAFPLGTFVVNMLGAFLLGAIFGAHADADSMKLAGVGFLGGFTTFSTWLFESEKLVADGHAGAASRNLVLSSALGLLFVAAGVAFGRAL